MTDLPILRIAEAVPNVDGLILLERRCKREVLVEARHHIPVDGHELIVDEYFDLLEGIVLAEIVLAEIVLAEIVLPTEHAKVPKPAWLGADVTSKQSILRSIW